jgi:hypothetical protein
MRSILLVEKTSRCNFKGCERSFDAALSHKKFCREHLLAICRNRLEAVAGLLTRKRLLPNNAEVARAFVVECAKAASDLMQTSNDLDPLDQSKLMEILLRVEDLSQQLLRLHS